MTYHAREYRIMYYSFEYSNYYIPLCNYNYYCQRIALCIITTCPLMCHIAYSNPPDLVA
jgi:hypothetical protein